MTTITERAAIVLQQIDAALALAERASPGPWEVKESQGWGKSHVTNVGTLMRHSERIKNEENASFVAASRTLLPASLRALKTVIHTFAAIVEADRLRGLIESAASDALTSICDQWESAQ